jgi:hypothetical protein
MPHILDADERILPRGCCNLWKSAEHVPALFATASLKATAASLKATAASLKATAASLKATAASLKVYLSTFL